MTIVLHVRQACGFLERARGLLASPVVAPGCGLLLHAVNAVHGFGMRRAIDLVFLDDRHTVVLCRRLPAWGIARCAKASATLEMRAGEAGRLGLRPGSRLELRPTADIFRQPDPVVAPAPSGEAQPSHACRQDRPYPPAKRQPLAMRAFLLMLALGGAASSQDAVAADAGSSARSVSGSSPRPASEQGRTLDSTTLRRFEAEADALYRESAPQVADAELVRLYEALATAAPQRQAHAWLRIGNIRQRAGAVGAAMDAYRKALDAADRDGQQAGAEDSRRKALLNLASLALEQARLALASLPPTLPAAGGHVAQLETLSRQLHRAAPRLQPPFEPSTRAAAQGPMQEPMQARRQVPMQAPPSLAAPAAASQEAVHVVERYTASARRNAVKAATGSLHTDPDDELPARPLSRPLPEQRSRPYSRARERLPEVEYLLGDPQRSQKTGRERQGTGAGK